MTTLNFDDVYGQHSAYARNILRRFGVRNADLDDALQDSFVTIHRLLSGFEGRAKLETWIHAICWRVAAGYRRYARRDCVTMTVEPEAAEQEERDLAPTARTEALHAALGTLEAEDLELLVLHDVGEVSVLALAEMTGRTRETVYRRIERARLSIAGRLGRAATAEEGAKLARPTAFRADEELLAKLAQDADAREYICRDYGFSRSGHVVFSRWRGAHDARALAILSKVLLGVAAETTDYISYCSIIDPSSDPPDADARRLTGWLVREVGHRLRVLATVSASAEHRRLLPQLTNACSFITRAEITVRHFDDASGALEWLAPLTPGASFPALMQHVEDVRLRMDALARD